MLRALSDMRWVNYMVLVNGRGIMKDMFDHLFYRFYWWNLNVVKERQLPIFSSFLGVSIFKVLNISTLIFTFLLLCVKGNSVYPKWLHALMMLAMLIVDYFIYIHKGQYKEIIERSKNLEKEKLRKKDIIIIVYMILTFVLLFWVIFEGRKLSV